MLCARQQGTGDTTMSFTKAGLLPAAILCLVALPAAAATRYDIIFAGNVSGQQTTSVARDGTISSTLSYRNNGRGPDLEERIVLAPDGTLGSYRVTGTSTFGSKIDESFSRRGDRVVWRSSADRGDQRVDGARGAAGRGGGGSVATAGARRGGAARRVACGAGPASRPLP